MNIEHDGITWRVEREFLESNWTCIWGRGCKGILDEPAETLGQGCCSVGAELADEAEAMNVAALAATLEPPQWQHHCDDVFSDERRTNTKVVDGACVFLNRPGFGGGEGCALHLAAIQCAESPVDWKPSVCWQLPIKVDWELHADGTETATLRRWARRDWGDEGATMAWCCTEGEEAYVGGRPVHETLAEQLEAVVGAEVWVELKRRLTG
jgi:hypothetical protein